MKYFLLIGALALLTGCRETREVSEVAVFRVDTIYVVRSVDGYRCEYARPPVPPKGEKMHCLWTSF